MGVSTSNKRIYDIRLKKFGTELTSLKLIEERRGECFDRRMDSVYVVVLHHSIQVKETRLMERFFNKHFDNTKIELRSREYD
jgi:hypothetical protein